MSQMGSKWGILEGSWGASKIARKSETWSLFWLKFGSFENGSNFSQKWSKVAKSLASWLFLGILRNPPKWAILRPKWVILPQNDLFWGQGCNVSSMVYHGRDVVSSQRQGSGMMQRLVYGFRSCAMGEKLHRLRVLTWPMQRLAHGWGVGSSFWPKKGLVRQGQA